MSKKHLGFEIEDRAGIKVIVEEGGGVRPATNHESDMWDLINQQNETLNLLREIIKRREEQAEVNNDKWINETKVLLEKLEALQIQK